MKKFTKTLVAAALLAAGTGAANASIATGSNTLSEAYLSVYDSSQGLTFTLDLGLTMGDLVTNIANAAFSKTYDLGALTANSSGGSWSAFSAGLNSLTTVYGLVVSGTAGKLMATGPAVSPTKFSTTNLASTTINALVGHITAVNTSVLADNAGAVTGAALNLSSIVSDTDTANTGQHNQLNSFSTLNGTKGDAGASLAYGSDASFYYYNGGASVTAAIQKWNLTGGILTYAAAAPAAVPLPAAVWMFGAGLMGVLRLNRRKSMAV